MEQLIIESPVTAQEDQVGIYLMGYGNEFLILGISGSVSDRTDLDVPFHLLRRMLYRGV
jgi:hypothetical protein